MSKQLASRTFPPLPVHLLLAGQTGLLSCSYSSCIHTYRAYKRGWSKSTRDPVAPAPSSSFIFPISLSRLRLSLAPISVSVYFSVFCSTFAPTWCHSRGAKIEFNLIKRELYFLFNFECIILWCLRRYLRTKIKLFIQNNKVEILLCLYKRYYCMYKRFRCREKTVNSCQIFLKFPLRRNRFLYNSRIFNTSFSIFYIYLKFIHRWKQHGVEARRKRRQRVPAGRTGYRLGNWDVERQCSLSIIFQHRVSTSSLWRQVEM